MTRIYRVKTNVGECRTFDSTSNGKTTKVKAIDLLLTDGKNEIHGTAYRETAEEVEGLKLLEGDIVQVQLSTGVSSRVKDGVTYYSNKVTIEGVLVVNRNSF